MVYLGKPRRKYSHDTIFRPMKTQLINMDDYEGIKYPDLDTKRAVIDKMLADKINELLLRVEELENGKSS